MMTFEQAKAIALKNAQELPMSYTDVDGFEPHAWVTASILNGYMQGYADGSVLSEDSLGDQYDKGYGDGWGHSRDHHTKPKKTPLYVYVCRAVTGVGLVIIGAWFGYHAAKGQIAGQCEPYGQFKVAGDVYTCAKASK